MRFSRSVGLLLAAVVAFSAATASVVTFVLVREDKPGAHKPLDPVAFVGVLHDPSGKPVANASIQLTAMYVPPKLKIGQGFRVPQLASTNTDAAGRFTIRQSQFVPIVRKAAASNGGWVNFRMEIGDGTHWMLWGAPRKVSPHGWLAADNPNLSAAFKVERLTFKPLQ